MSDLFNMNYSTFKQAQAMRAAIEEFSVRLHTISQPGYAERGLLGNNPREVVESIHSLYYDVMKSHHLEY